MADKKNLMDEFVKEFVKDNPIVTQPFSENYSKIRQQMLEAELNFDKKSAQFAIENKILKVFCVKNNHFDDEGKFLIEALFFKSKDEAIKYAKNGLLQIEEFDYSKLVDMPDDYFEMVVKRIHNKDEARKIREIFKNANPYESKGFGKDAEDIIKALSAEPQLDTDLPKFCIAHHCTQRSKACAKCAYTAMSGKEKDFVNGK